MRTYLIAIALLLAVVACTQPAPPVQPQGALGVNNAPQQPLPQEQKSALVTIAGFRFTPDQVSVPVGTTVTWTNQDTVTHTVKGADFVSPDIPAGGSYEHTFTAAGTYQYVCGIHPSMQGTIVVG